MHVLRGHRHAVRALAYAPGDPLTLASAGDDRTVRLWDLGPAQRSVVLSSHQDGLVALAFAPDGSLATGGRSGSLAVWDVPELRQRTTYALQGPAIALAFSPDSGSILAALRSQHFAGEAPRLVRWPHRAEDRPAPLPWPDDVESAVFGPDGILAVAGQHRTVETWGVGGSRSLSLWCASRVRCLAFSPGGHALAIGHGRTIACHDLPSLGRRLLYKGHRSDVLAVAFAPDGLGLLSGGADRTVRLWDLATGRERAAWDWQIGRVQAVAFSPDGMTAAAGGEKSAVVVWDVDEG